MKEKILKSLKITFLIHFFLSIIFGLVFMIFWDVHNAIFDWKYSDPVASRIFGAALVGFAASSLLAWRETEWLRVKIVVQMEIAWTAIGIVVMIISIIFNFPSVIIYLYLSIFIIFLGVFSWFYFQQEK